MVGVWSLLGNLAGNPANSRNVESLRKGAVVETALEFYISKIDNFESMTFEERRAAAQEAKLADKQHTKTTLKELFRVKPAKGEMSRFSYKNGYGEVLCFTLSQCVPMRALAKSARTAAQEEATRRLIKHNSINSLTNQVALTAAHAVNSGDLLVIDTETTDLNGQVIEIAVVCAKTASRLYSSFVKATESISDEAFSVHGISEKDIEDAPSFEQVATEISKLFTESKRWTAFNIEFDHNVMLNSAHNKNANCYKWLNQSCFCSMYGIAAPFFGATNKYGSISLANAMGCCGIEFEGQAHSASADAVATAKVLQYIANKAIN